MTRPSWLSLAMRSSNLKCYDLSSGGAPIEKWEAETSPNNPGNCHWKAWDYADELVERMRGKAMTDKLIEMYEKVPLLAIR